MNKTKRFDLKTILTLISVLVLSLSVLFTAGCGKTEDSSSSSSSSSSTTKEESVKDYQTITNGDFEFGTDDETKATDYPVNTGINWSRANDSLTTSAVTSNYASGIIDTNEEVYNQIAKDQAFPIVSGEGDSAVYFNPRSPYYYGLIEKSYAFDKEVENEDGLPTTGSKILMIHNKIKAEDGRGTAQKFTSSKTIDIAADSYNKVSLWVLTKDLKTLQDTNDFGAYVALNTTVSSSKNPLVINNINTDGNWAQINFYIEGSSLLTTSYKLVLGLGTGSRKVKDGYVEGFAYFDNVTIETLTKAEYDQATGAIVAENKYSLFVSDADNAGFYKDATKSELQASLTGATYLSNGNASESYDATKTFTKFDYTLSFDIPSVSDSNVFLSSEANVDVYPNGGSNFCQGSEIGEGAFSTISAKLDGVTNPVGSDAQTVYMIYPEVASHTLNTKAYTLKDGEAMLLTFLTKVKTANAQDAVTVSVVDNGTTTTPIDEATVIATSYNTNDYENEETANWAKFFIYVSNDIGDGLDRQFSLKIDFGPTNPTTEYFALPVGYALFTGFETTMLTPEQFEIGKNFGDYTGNVSLGAELINGPKDDEDSKDVYSLNYATSDNYKIESNLSSTVVGFIGVVGGHTMVGGESTAYSQDVTKTGLFNTKYIDNYTTLSASEIESLKALEKNADNDYVQALLINNTSAASYGYLGTSNTISASSTSTIAVKLKVFGDAKAYVYLTNSNPLEGFDVLGLSAPKWTFANDEVTYSDNEYLVDKKYVQTVTASECANGWITVYFKVTAGINAINYRVEVWNGSRDGADKSQGMVAIESISTSASLSEAKLLADNEGGEVSEIEYKRAPTLVAYTTDDGKESTKFQEYNSQVVFTEYSKAKAIIATHQTVDAETSLDETTDKEEDLAPEEETEANTNWWLQVMSLIIAIVLIIAVIAVAFRLFKKRVEVKETVINEGYSRNTRDIANRKIAENKRRKAEEAERLAKEEANAQEKASEETQVNGNEENAETEEALPEYDYDNMENNLLPEETVENAETPATENAEAVEEPTSETTDADDNGDKND